MTQFATRLTADCIHKCAASGFWPDKVATDFLLAAATAHPDKVAIVDRTRAISYGELRQLVDRCAHGLLDSEGYIVITGRAKDIIIRGGENIPVKYVEDVLYEDDRVQEVALVAMPDDRLGERPCAFVTCRAGCDLTIEDMRSFLQNKGIARQYWPERLEIQRELPRSAYGKIKKSELKERIALILQKERAGVSSRCEMELKSNE